MEEILIWIIKNNQDKDIRLPDDDFIIEANKVAIARAKADMTRFER
jgi:hypothetical protein